MDVDKMPMESVNALGVLISHLFSDFWASRKEKGLFSAWDSFAQDAICNKDIKAQKKTPKKPSESQWAFTHWKWKCDKWCAGMLTCPEHCFRLKGFVFDAVEFLPAAHAVTAEIKLFPGFSLIIHTHLPQRWTSLKVLWLSNSYASYLWSYQVWRTFPGKNAK